MAYEVEQKGELGRLAHVTVAAEEYEGEVNRPLRQLSKRVRIQGFRKGKIPLSVMRRNYGPSVQQDVIEQLVNDQVTKILKDADRVIFLGRPEVTQLPSAGKPLSFKVEYELRPELDPIGYMGLEVERPTTEVSAERIDERVEQLREQHATLQPIEGREVIEDGDSVELDFRAVGDEPELVQLYGGREEQEEIGDPGLDVPAEL